MYDYPSKAGIFAVCRAIVKPSINHIIVKFKTTEYLVYEVPCY